MLSESLTASRSSAVERGWSAADFLRRVEPADMPEWMDEPCTSDVLAGCLRDLERVNRLTMSYRPTLGFLSRAIGRRAGREPLHVVDVGSGYGDMLRVIYRWARRRGVQLRLTGIDLNPQAAAIAAEATRAAGLPADAIKWRSGDAMTERSTQSPDVVVSSLVAHHLSHAEVVRFVRWMEGRARVGWFINDLERQRMPARMFGVLARVMRWHRFVQHDGPVSFRRAFRVADWEQMLGEACVAAGSVRIASALPARLCVERLR